MILKTNFLIKIGDIHKIEKRNSISISVFGYESKGKHSIFASKSCCEETQIDLLLIEKEEQRHYILIKEFNAFMYGLSLHGRIKHFCRYCLQVFSTEGTFKRHIKDSFKINDKQMILMIKKGEYVKIQVLCKVKKVFIYNLHRF